MQFGSSVGRGFWWTVALRFIPSIIVAAGFSIALDGGLPYFFAGILILEGLGLVAWILNGLVDRLIFALHGRSYMSRHLAGYLRENSFPEPDSFENSVDSYLHRTMEDKKVSPQTRLGAAIEVGSLATWHLLNKSGAKRMELAYEDALHDYKRQFPPKEAINKGDIDFDDSDE